MAHFRMLALLLPISLLFGCLSFGTQQSPSPLPQKSLAESLGVTPSEAYTAYYATTATLSGEKYEGALTLYVLGNLTRLDASYPSLYDYSFFMLGGKQYTCGTFGNEKRCRLQELPADAGGFAYFLRRPANLFSVEQLPSRNVSGMESRCFLLSQTSSSQQPPLLSCYSKSGVPTYVLSSEAKGVASSEATIVRIRAAPNEKDFALPYEIMQG